MICTMLCTNNDVSWMSIFLWERRATRRGLGRLNVFLRFPRFSHLPCRLFLCGSPSGHLVNSNVSCSVSRITSRPARQSYSSSSDSSVAALYGICIAFANANWRLIKVQKSACVMRTLRYFRMYDLHLVSRFLGVPNKIKKNYFSYSLIL